MAPSVPIAASVFKPVERPARAAWHRIGGTTPCKGVFCGFAEPLTGPERERAAGWQRGGGADFNSAPPALRASPNSDPVANGQRVAKTVGAATTHCIYAGDALIAEADGATDATTAEYIAFNWLNLA